MIKFKFLVILIFLLVLQTIATASAYTCYYYVIVEFDREAAYSPVESFSNSASCSQHLVEGAIRAQARDVFEIEGVKLYYRTINVEVHYKEKEAIDQRRKNRANSKRRYKDLISLPRINYQL